MTTISGVTAVATSASSQLTRNMITVAADDREHVLEEEDEAVAEEEADGLEVDRRSREELAGLVAVVEAEREAEQLRVERVSHVELDSERLTAGDQATARHEDRARRADAKDERSDDVELVRALGVDRLLQSRSRQVRDPDRRDLGADREHDRDDQRPLVRLQKAEQADERLAIRDLCGHSRNLAFATCVPLRCAARLGRWARSSLARKRSTRTICTSTRGC